jgi:hypothetical protein
MDLTWRHRRCSAGASADQYEGALMRILHGHKVNPANDVLEVKALDGPGPGGASHDYQIKLPDGSGVRLGFQNGPINEVGVNGITHEALLAILIDRMEGFQSGPFANDYNAAALCDLQSAQKHLLDRTRDRMARNVEGTMKP